MREASNEISRREFVRRSVFSAAAVAVGGTIFSAPAEAAQNQHPAGNYSKLLQNGSQDFLNPHGLAFAPDGCLLVCDSGRYQVRKFRPDGTEVTDGFPLGINPFNPPLDREIVDDSLLNFPEDVAVAPDGTVYVASTCSGEVVVFDASGNRIGTVGILGPRDGELYMPGALAHGPDGLLVADSRNARIQVFDSDGGFRKAFWRVEVRGEKKNGKDGYEKEYRDLFRTATCVAVTPDGRIVASDESTDSVFFIIPKEDRVEVKPIKWGFKNPHGLAVDRKGRIYVCNTGRSKIDIFNPDGTHDLSHSVYHAEKRLREPVGVAIEPQGQRVFVTDAKLGCVARAI